MAIFARRHYEAIAQALQKTHPGDVAGDIGVGARIQWAEDMQALCNVLRADNAQFDVARFQAACQPGANVRARG